MPEHSTTLAPNDAIQVTTNYDAFHIMDANREANRGHIEALKAAFEEMGNLTRVQPILVNNRMEIIDGQHRFIACQELDQPIYYTQVEGLGIADARSINILHRKWEMGDYARSYALSGDANYQRFLRLVEESGFSNSVVLYAATAGREKGAFKNFRQGNFTLSPERAQETQARLDSLSGVAEISPLANTGTFALAYLQALNNENFDESTFLTRLERNPHLLVRQPGVPEYLRNIEEIFNYHVQVENRVRLF